MCVDSVFRSCYAILAVAALSLPATAQLVQNLALAYGTHANGSPSWTENVPDPAAEAGVVDQLNWATWLELASPQVVLLPGTYVAQAKVAKTLNTIGIADLTVSVRAGATVLGSTTLPATQQPVDVYVWSPEVIFTVHQPTTVEVAVLHTAFVMKENYRFDTARIGFVPTGKVVRHDSLDTWNYTNAAWYDHYIAEPSAVYGRVAQRNNAGGFSWLEIYKLWNLDAGTHVANVRLRNLIGPGLGYAEDLSFVMLDAVTLTELASVTIPAAAQQAGVWVQSPDLVVTLPAAGAVYFMVRNYWTSGGYGYQFDSFTLRSSASAFSPYGAGCGGLTLTQPVGGQVGTAMTLQIANGGAALLGLFAFGSPLVPIPLDFLGATGCLLHVTPDVLLSGVFVAGTCSASVSVPNLPSMFGLTLDVQGAAFDPTAPGSLRTANAGQTYIGW